MRLRGGNSASIQIIPPQSAAVAIQPSHEYGHGLNGWVAEYPVTVVAQIPNAAPTTIDPTREMNPRIVE